MLLNNKIAVIYGAGGAIGGAVARSFAREGAKVFLSGRNAEPVEAVARDIVAAGGEAEVANVDALDEDAVRELAQRYQVSVQALTIRLMELGFLSGVPNGAS